MASVLKPRPPPAPTAAAVANSALKQFGMRPFPRPRGLAGIDLLMQELQRQPQVGGGESAPSTPTGASTGGANTARVLGDATNRARRMLIKPELPQPSADGWPLSARAAESAVAHSAALRWPAPHPPSQASRPSSPGRGHDDNALRQHPCLTSFERREIAGFDSVYFVGEKARKVHGASTMGTNNYGYDDDKCDYKVIMDDQIAYRYQVCQELGRGSFGQVSKAYDHKTREHVAIKIIKNKKKFHEQALVEIKVLKHLNDADAAQKSCIVRLIDHFVFRNHTILVFPLLGESLYDVLKANRFQPLQMSSVRSYAKQMAQCLALSHRERVVHCDLKPENVLVRGQGSSSIRVIDFGSSCFESEKIYTYIQSRFYRAPEIILGIPYTTAIDMWSLGCMLAELANGYPLFPGENEAEQIQCIMEYLGAPPASLVDRGPKKRLFFDSTGAPRVVPNSRGKVRKPSTKSLPSFLKSPCDASQNALFMDFIRRCLAWEPSDRMTPLEALRHPFLDDAGTTATATQSAQPLTSRVPSLSGMESGLEHLLPRLAHARRRDA